MSEDALIRRENLKRLRIDAATLRDRAGSRISYWHDLISDPKKSFGEKAARRIEAALELPRGWLDEDHDNVAQKYDALEITQNQPLAITKQAHTAIDDVAAALQVLCRSLGNLDPSRRGLVIESLATLVKSPDDALVMDNLAKLLSDSGFASQLQKVA